ncbi:serine/threonine-protein kinase [Streptomyces sp. NPDC057245]|uniref:serine/threonine-protein kinase n=1 Tax=Streptomyces sp. NPDC057245 TaxID=3346065 RepID=UPI00362568BB
MQRMAFEADPPQRIGDYTVERELGAGGMGTVYLARSRGGRAVAVKVVRPELAADPHFRQRFRAEVDAARKVGGFHTAPVVDADPEGERPWLATAYIAGPTLSELLADEGPMDEAGLRLLGAALAEALQAVHACGLVHRDLKPGNIIMAEDGPRVLDFGIARAVESSRLTSTGMAFGTPGFLAPEQAQGLSTDGSADVFALGAVLVSAAGGSAFGTGTPMGLMYRSVHEPADLSSVPEALRPLIADCLAKNPAYRPGPEQILDLLVSGSAPYTPTVVATAGQQGQTATLPAAFTPAGGRADALAEEHPADGSADRGPQGGGLAGTVGPGRSALAGQRRGRAVGLAAVAAGVLGAVVAGVIALTTDGDSAAAPSSSSSSPSSPDTASAAPGAGGVAPSAPAQSSAQGATPTASAADSPDAPEHTPLDPHAVDQVFTQYLDALVSQDMTALRQATCPRLRPTLKGFVLNDYYVARWNVLPYEIPAASDRFSVDVRITQRDPASGELAGDVTYQWVAERDADGDYWVCGWLNER